MKSCLKLFIALWVWHAVLSQRHRRKLNHTIIFSCSVGGYASRCYVQTSGACTSLLSCYSKELGIVELLQIKKLKGLLGHYLLPDLELQNRSTVRPLRMQCFESLIYKHVNGLLRTSMYKEHGRIYSLTCKSPLTQGKQYILTIKLFKLNLYTDLGNFLSVFTQVDW